MSNNDRLVIGNGLLAANSRPRTKQRVSVEVTAEPVIIDVDHAAITKVVAAHVAEYLRGRVKSIAASASPATIRARKVAAKAYAEGKAWALARYSAPPNQSTRAFNDSGQFAESIRAKEVAGHWNVHVSSNRLNNEDGFLDRIIKRLRELVPEILDVSRLANTSAWHDALREVQSNSISKEPARTTPLH